MAQFGSIMAGIMFITTIFNQWFPQQLVNDQIKQYFQKLVTYIYPYLHITFHEYQGDEFQRNKAYIAIERYLSTNSSNRAKRLKANVIKDCKSLVLSIDDNEQVTDEFKGINIWWTSSKTIPQQRSMFSYYPDDEKRFYKLTCHRKDRYIIIKDYLQHVLDEGKTIAIKTRQRKLYTNNKTENDGRWGSKRTMWSHIIFEHPSTFDTLAMDPKKKKEILNDLKTFSNSKDYYKKVGKS